MIRSGCSALAGTTLMALALALPAAAYDAPAGGFQAALTEVLAKAGDTPVLVDFYTDW